MLVDYQLFLKLKGVDKLTEIHEAQLLTCTKLSSITTGLLINFNVTKLEEGTKRFVL